MNQVERHIVENVERLLIELACDSSLTAHELQDQTQVICKLLISSEAKLYVLDRLSAREENYYEQGMYRPIIECLMS